MRVMKPISCMVTTKSSSHRHTGSGHPVASGVGDSDVQGPTGVFFWARSGGGHRTAKEGIKQQKIKEYAARGQALATHADYDITGEKVLSSVALPFFGGLGDIGVNAWDEAQKKGDLKFLERYASFGWLAEILLYPIVYFRVKWLLQDLHVEPQFIVSTQAFCLNAIMRAMQTVNKEKQWNMHMHVYLTDMPSKKAIHFFPSIKKVTQDRDLRRMLTLHAPAPILKQGQSAQEFWRKYCGKVNVITDEQFPIREAFLETEALKERLEQGVVEVKLKLNHPSETDILQAGLTETASEAVEVDNSEITLQIRDQDKLAFLMLGSQPTTQSVLSWLHTFVKTKQGDEADLDTDLENQRYLFLYCGVAHTDDTRNPLLDAVHAEIARLKEAGKLPTDLNIVPFTNQSADEIALLMARSDVSITRSGGATSMELLQLHEADLPKRENKLTLIHSEALSVPEDARHSLDHEAFARKIVLDIQEQLGEGGALLDDPELQGIKEEMEHFCQQLGYSKKKSQRMVDNVLRMYLHADTAGGRADVARPDLEEVFAAWKQTKLLAKAPNSADVKIEAEMKRLRQNAKYQDLEIIALRQLAIEKVLTREGIVLWEGGNAKYLQKKIGAHVTNPQYAQGLLTTSFIQS